MCCGDALKGKEGFFYNSVEMDVVKMKAGNSQAQYHIFRSLNNIVSSFSK